MKHTDRLWSRDDVIEFLGISRRKFSYLRSQGAMVPPMAKVGRAMRFSPVEVREWAKAGCPMTDVWEDMKCHQGFSNEGVDRVSLLQGGESVFPKCYFMGDVYKPTYHRVIPAKAKWIQRDDKQYVRFKLRNGRSVEGEVLAGGKRCCIETSEYYGRIKQPNGRVRRIPLGVTDSRPVAQRRRGGVQNKTKQSIRQKG